MPLTTDGLLSVGLTALPAIIVAYLGHRNALSNAKTSHEEFLIKQHQLEIDSLTARHSKQIELKDAEIKVEYDKRMVAEAIIYTQRKAYEVEIAGFLATSKQEREQRRNLDRENQRLKFFLEANNISYEDSSRQQPQRENGPDESTS